MGRTAKDVCAAKLQPAKRFSRKALIALLGPLLLEQFLSISMGMIDTLMVAGVGEAAMSSVSLVDNVNALVIQVLAALTTGGAIVTSQYLGRRDTKNAQRGAAQLYMAVLLVTALSSVVFAVLRRPVLQAVFGTIDREVMAFAETYFFVSALSYPFIGIYNVGAALFRAQGNSRVSMRASLVMNVINVSGNALLIYGFGMGVLGAALATLAGRVFAAVWITVRLQQYDCSLRIARFADLKPDVVFIRRVLSIGVPAGLENGIFHIGKLLVAHVVSSLGTAAIAANAVAMSLHNFANIPGKAIGLAMIPVIGQCLGAGEKKEARSYAIQLLLLCYGGLWITNVLLYAFIPSITPFFSLAGEAARLTVEMVRLSAIFSMVLWPLSFLLPHTLRAGGDVKLTMFVSIFSMWAFRIGLTDLFVNRLGIGLIGVWLSMFVDWGARGVMFLWRFLRGKWMENKVI